MSAIVAKGYKIDYNLKAATYDFRLTPSGLRKKGYYLKLKALIESMVSKFGKKVVLVVHSMGNPILNHFLVREVDQEWKDKHIEVWTAIAPAFMGAPKSLKVRVETKSLKLASGSELKFKCRKTQLRLLYREKITECLKFCLVTHKCGRYTEHFLQITT